MASNTCNLLDNESKKYLQDLSEKIRESQVVLFVGAGMSKNAVRKSGSSKEFPLWGDIVTKMLQKLYPCDKDTIEKEKSLYTEVADKFENEFGRNELNRLLENILEDSQYLPGEIHRLICKFDWEIITTNFDTLIERAFESVRNESNVIYNDSHLTGKKKPCIYKINGCIKNARDEIIITAEDFRRFSEKKPLMELYVKKCFIESTVLFVGFSLKDPAFQIIHGWVRDRLLDIKSNRFAYSIQNHIDDLTKKIWISRGIRFIELFPSGNIEKNQVENRIYEVFNFLYQDQINNGEVNIKAAYIDWENANLNLKKDLEKCLNLFEKEDKKSKKKSKAQVKAVRLQLESLLFKRLIEIISNFGTCGELFEDRKITGLIYRNLEKILMLDNLVGVHDPNIWIMAICIALRIGISHKLVPVEFFKKGFTVLRKAALKEFDEYKISEDLQRYWLFSLILIGPFKCAEIILDISRKTHLQSYPWYINEYIHYHLEVFFGDRFKCHDLFLRALNNFRTSDKGEAYYKFLLLDTFLKEHEKKKFDDPFLNRTYISLSGQFREKTHQFRDILASISFPVKESYFKSVVQTIFNEVYTGKSLMFTDASSFVLSFPGITIEKRDIETFKTTSLGELFLLAIIYDKSKRKKEREKEFKDFITLLIDSGVINVSYFLRLLLFRLEGADLKKMVQEADNGISRYLTGLVFFILCVLPYLENEDLLEIKNMIVSCLEQIKLNDIREALVQIIGYISNQLLGQDFTPIFKTIFSLSTDNYFSPIGLKFLKLPLKKTDSKDIIKYSQIRLLLDLSQENPGTPFERDFINFMLNHNREELFPDEDVRIKNKLKAYFDFIKIENPKHLSLQWLMDLNKFIEKGFIKFDSDMERDTEEFIDAAFEIPEVYYEWKIFSAKMIPIYKTFAHLFKSQVMSNIIEIYLKDHSGKKYVSLKVLDKEIHNNFAHLLKEIYVSEHHNSLNDSILKHIKKFVNEGLSGGGHLGAFWDKLSAKEQKQLTTVMLKLWLPASEVSILEAIRATGEFLKYQTDRYLMKELTNRLIYCIFSGSTAVKIEWCKVVAIHINENSPWYNDNKKKILNFMDLFKIEKSLELLREFLYLARSLSKDQIKEPINYLRDNAPYAEIRRTAKWFV